MNMQKTIGRFTLSAITLSAILAAPAAAHQVQIAGDIGGTLHIEPNDNPRAGEPSLTWFALTRQGGELIPLEACNCQLSIHTQPSKTIVQSPPLEPVSAEGYTGIPGAEITFPQVGSYELVLQGEPTTPEDFQPFELRFPVTVAAGQAIPSSQSETEVEQATPAIPTETETQPANNGTFWQIGITLTLIAVSIALLLSKSKPKRE